MVKKVIKLKSKPIEIPPKFQKELNSEQLQAVLHSKGPALVIAGAGSGKTRMLTYRVAYLINQHVPADAILLVTFTKKAAQEMISRVQGLVGKEIHGLKAGTFHHIANLALRKYASQMGYSPNFTILDPGDQKQFMKLIVANRFNEMERRRFPKPPQILDIASKTINLGKSLKDVLSEYYPSYEDLGKEIAETIEVFKKQKKSNNVMDFDDLLVNYLKFLRNDSISQTYRDSIHHVLVDEYQDVNAIQAQIVIELGKHAKSVTVVGDDAQSIYRFRGGNYEHMLDFPSIFPNCQIYKLETNYRSTPEILALANASISKNKIGFSKTLRAIRESKERPMMVPCYSLEQEAQLICQQILFHRDENIPLHEQAVLFRARFHAIELEQELVRQKIPYEMRAGVRFFEQAHIKDLIAFLSILANPTDTIQWIRVLSMHEGVSDNGAQKIITQLSKRPNLLNGFVFCNLEIEMRGKRLRKIGLENLQTLQKFYQKLAFENHSKELLPEEQWPSLPEIIRKITNYLEPIFPSRYIKNYEDRLADLKELQNFAAKYHSVREFLADILTQYNLQGKTNIQGDKIEDEKPLILSTIHQAKGLEWKVVYVINLVDGRMPSSRSIGDPQEIEEERRLFYVACTRAKDVLYLTYPEIVRRFDRDQLNGPSQFLEEIEKDEVFDEVEIEED